MKANRVVYKNEAKSVEALLFQENITIGKFRGISELINNNNSSRKMKKYRRGSSSEVSNLLTNQIVPNSDAWVPQ